MKRIVWILALLFIPCVVFSDVRTKNIDSTAIDVQALTDPGGSRYYRLNYVSVTNSSDVARAEVILRDGNDATDPRLLSTITLNPGESTERIPGILGPRMNDGLYVDVVLGEVELTILYE